MKDKPKRPRDANQLAHMIVGIATGEVEEKKKAKSLGSKGGVKRAESLSPERRSEIAKAAANARWEVRPAPFEED